MVLYRISKITLFCLFPLTSKSSSPDFKTSLPTSANSDSEERRQQQQQQQHSLSTQLSRRIEEIQPTQMGPQQTVSYILPFTTLHQNLPDTPLHHHNHNHKPPTNHQQIDTTNLKPPIDKTNLHPPAPNPPPPPPPEERQRLLRLPTARARPPPRSRQGALSTYPRRTCDRQRYRGGGDGDAGVVLRTSAG